MLIITYTMLLWRPGPVKPLMPDHHWIVYSGSVHVWIWVGLSIHISLIASSSVCLNGFRKLLWRVIQQLIMVGYSIYPQFCKEMSVF